MEDAEDECKNAQQTVDKLKAALSSKAAGTTTIGFGAASAGTGDAAAPIELKKANDISNLVRKRKPEEQTNGTSEIKKPKPDESMVGDKENEHDDQTVPEEA